MPSYVERAHDQVLAAAVRDARAGRSRLLIVVGASATGKTRACWEAVQPLAEEGWRLWHPIEPARARALAAGLERVRARTVVWLNEAQHYLGDPLRGEDVVAGLRNLLASPERGPILVLGTLWPQYAEWFMRLPAALVDDEAEYRSTRHLLAGRMVTIPDAFDEEELYRARVIAQDDCLLADTLTRAGADGRVTQDLAGAPELLRRYVQAPPACRALLEAAMDARRLGVGLRLPQAFLSSAAIGYLKDHEYEELAEDWEEAAYADLARPVHGRHAPLRPTRVRPDFHPASDVSRPTPPSPQAPVVRLADYLEQWGSITRQGQCPPDSFWHAAHAHLARPDDLGELARAARALGLSLWAHHLSCRACEAGHPDALYVLALTRQHCGDLAGAQALFQQAADAGDSDALYELALLLEAGKDLAGAEAAARRAVAAGSIDTLFELARLREKGGNRQGAELLYAEAAHGGDLTAVNHLARLREQAADRDGAHALYQQAADAGDVVALFNLVRMKEQDGDRTGAEALALQAAAAGHVEALYELALLREGAGDRDSAEALYQQAAKAGDITAATWIERRRAAADNAPDPGGDLDENDPDPDDADER
ncbi:hypothetical protein [Streptomyces sp. NPDC046197]|uniref:hypothetical protein n=1 Tax=Streptomyces sp. NPDC046197 TaxID=3154337 RepID=UPI00341056EC